LYGGDFEDCAGEFVAEDLGDVEVTVQEGPER